MTDLLYVALTLLGFGVLLVLLAWLDRYLDTTGQDPR